MSHVPPRRSLGKQRWNLFCIGQHQHKVLPIRRARLNTASYGDKAYTGQQKELISSQNAYYYHARFYSPDLGHFMSGDPLTNDGLNRYAYVRNNPIGYSDPSGKCAGWGFLGCTDDNIKNFFNCATGGSCDAGAQTDDVRRLSRWVIGQMEFWHNVWKHSAGTGLLNGELLLSFVRNVKSDPSQWGNMSALGWRYMADLAATTESYFQASLKELIFGGHPIQGLSGWDFAHASPWWRNTGSWGHDEQAYQNFTDLWNIFGDANRNAAEQDFESGTVAAYKSDPNILWSPEQGGVIVRASFPQPPTPYPDYWRHDLNCYFGHVGDCNNYHIPRQEVKALP
jgi:RHS repeat-associated protein